MVYRCFFRCVSRGRYHYDPARTIKCTVSGAAFQQNAEDQGSRAEEGDQPQHRQGLLLHHAQYGAEPEPAQHQGEVIHLSKKEVGFFLLFKLTIKCTVAGAVLQLRSKSENCDGWSV